jgi:hypothetical protein
MITTTARRLLLAVAFAASSGCASIDAARHEYVMRGQILDASGDEVYLCVGKSDGAEVGQELDVQHITVVQRGSPKASQAEFKRSSTGRVRIVALVDAHYAKAQVLSGDPQVNDVVELRTP